MKKIKRWLSTLLALMIFAFGMAPCAYAGGFDWGSALLDIIGLGEYLYEESYSYDDYDYEYEYTAPITDPQEIVNYIAENGWLPDNFITKEEARDMGWDSSRNYVGDVAPGMSIGGDRFGNYEGLLPDKQGRKWYECDANYKGDRRGAERVVFSSDGLFYYTDDHYESFIQLFPED